MIQRSRAREVALQMLFQRDSNADVARRDLERFARERLPRSPEAAAFALALYDGVVGDAARIDAAITAAAENWRLPRMAAVDRNVLRLATHELLAASADAPGPVVLNEAIELARRYGAADSPAFVNGVLDRIYRTAQAAAT